MSTLETLKNLEHDEETYSDLNLGAVNFLGKIFENCTFARCNLNSVDLSKTRFISCKFVDCDMSNIILKNSRMRDTSFSGCKLIGIQWVYLDDFTNPSFEECILQYANFVGLKLKRTKFFKSNLREVDFSQADLTECDFRESDMAKTRFNETNLTKADFRGAVNYILDPLANKIRAARFSMPEVQGLLTGLGVIID
jgi:fluoroquinolone resistance protein